MLQRTQKLRCTVESSLVTVRLLTVQGSSGMARQAKSRRMALNCCPDTDRQRQREWGSASIRIRILIQLLL